MRIRLGLEFQTFMLEVRMALYLFFREDKERAAMDLPSLLSGTASWPLRRIGSHAGVFYVFPTSGHSTLDSGDTRST